MDSQDERDGKQAGRIPRRTVVLVLLLEASMERLDDERVSNDEASIGISWFERLCRYECEFDGRLYVP